MDSRRRAQQSEVMRRLNADPEFRRKVDAGRFKRRFPSETRAKIAASVAEAYRRGDYRNQRTWPELALRNLLQTADFEFKEQVRFGRYVVDAWVPSRGLVFEADCSFWYHHQDKEREAKRDAYLVARGVIAVVHLTESDLRDLRATTE